jgi:hypothetical protein
MTEADAKPPNTTVVHVVREGQPAALPIDEANAPAHRTPRRARFRNTLQPESLARIRSVVEIAPTIERPTPTKDVIDRARAAVDTKGASGALRMLDVQGVVHATAGPRRQLIWCPGQRPNDSDRPRGLKQEIYQRLRDLLQHGNQSWHSTDFLLVTAGFDPHLHLGEHVLFGRPIRERDLPVNTFRDAGKSARKFVLGALKALYWLELLAWRNYSSQAVEWWWVGPAADPGQRLAAVPERALRPNKDPYLTDHPPRLRAERLTEGAIDRWTAYNEDRQRWIDKHHPEAAAEYRYRQWLRKEQDRLKLREAKKWGWRTGA